METRQHKAGVPVLRSMQEYIIDHYQDEIIEELKPAVCSGMMNEELCLSKESRIVCVDDQGSKLLHAEFWMMDRTSLQADIRMRIKVGVEQEDQMPHYYVRTLLLSKIFILDHGI